MIDVVQQVLDEDVRPILRSHQGDLQLLKVKDGIVTIKLVGACSGCPGADMTVKDVVESALAEKVDGFLRVELSREVSPELLDIAKKILSRSRGAY